MPAARHTTVFDDRRQDFRIIVGLNGHFSITSRRAVGYARPVFSCRAITVSSRAIALISGVDVKIGDQIKADVEHLGKLDGSVFRLLGRAFVMSMALTDADRQQFDDKIEWLERFKNLDTHEQRADRRFIPARRRTTMVFADGSLLYCLIRDLSASGAAISTDTIPAIGTVLAVGAIVGRVVRHFKGGFALNFIERQSDDRLDAMTRGV